MSMSPMEHDARELVIRAVVNHEKALSTNDLLVAQETRCTLFRAIYQLQDAAKQAGARMQREATRDG